MDYMGALIDELVLGNHILANEQVVDSYGHISVRHPDRPDRFLLSCSRSPEMVNRKDIMEFDLDGNSVTKTSARPYLERFIHAAIFATRPDVNSVVHSHSPSVIPFSVTPEPLRPVMHTAALIGDPIPKWDIRDEFGETDMLVRSMETAQGLARALGEATVVLMRGHGSTVVGPDIRRATITAIYLQMSAAVTLQALSLGPVTYLSPEEIAHGINLSKDDGPIKRVWDNLVHRLG